MANHPGVQKKPSELGTSDYILFYFHRTDRSSLLALSLPRLLINSAHLVCNDFHGLNVLNSALRSHLGVGCLEEMSTAINHKSPSHSPEFPQCFITLNTSFK